MLSYNKLAKHYYFFSQAKLVLHHHVDKPLTLPFIRDILYNLAFAKKNNGSLDIVIQDLPHRANNKQQPQQDLSAIKKKNTDKIAEFTDSLEWTGLLTQSGISIKKQSDFLKDIYPKYDKKLLAAKHMYPCFCTHDRLKELEKYDGHCKQQLTREEMQVLVQNKNPYRMRFKGKQVQGRGKARNTQEITVIKDFIRGETPVTRDMLDHDFVVRETDGLPSDLMASMVDQLELGATHIIQPFTEFQNIVYFNQLYNALRSEEANKQNEINSHQLPGFVFLPEISQKSLLTVEELNAKEYLPMSVLNYAMLEGWKPYGTGLASKINKQKYEVFHLDEFVNYFEFDKVIKEKLRFDKARLDRFNTYYLRKTLEIVKGDTNQKEMIKEFRERLKELVHPDFPNKLTDHELIKLNNAATKKLQRVSDLKSYIAPYVMPPSFKSHPHSLEFLDKTHNQRVTLLETEGKESIVLTENNAQTKRNKKIVQNLVLILDHIIKDYSQISFAQKISEFLMDHKADKIENELVYGLLRVWVTGNHKIDNILLVCAILGKQQVLKRLKSALEVYQSVQKTQSTSAQSPI